MNLIVYSGGVRAGTLDMAPNEPFYGFTYDRAYLESQDAAPLSASLPLQAGRFDGARAMPYFEGLLPEGDVRASVARQLGVSEHSPAKLLRALGKDCAGDVAVLEEDDPYQPPADGAYAPLEGGLARIARNPYGEISRLRAGNRLSLAGGQEKISLYHDDRLDVDSGWYVPVQGSPSTHIVKPQVLDAYPCIAYNEFLCMKAAKALGLNVANVELAIHERPLLVIERYDREKAGRKNELGLELYRRLRQEDFCQALGFDSSRKYEADGGPGVADMNRLLLSRSVQFIADREMLARLVLFNYLIGNCDAHAKNYSAMLGRTGAVMLAPAYDLLSTTVYAAGFGADLSRGMGMKIGGHSNIDRVTPDDFGAMASSLGIRPEHLAGMGRELAEKAPGALAEAADSLAGRQTADISQLVSRLLEGIERRSRVLAG